jgi:diguanylate cyclase (GGDEF)-like protein/PAS domain S-box-containing protein
MHQTGKVPAGRSAITPVQARALLLQPPVRDAFDRAVRLAALALRAPVATLGVADDERLLLVGQLGVPEPWRSAGALPLHATVCRHVLHTAAACAVDDIARDPPDHAIPHLENFPRAAYCGAPLIVDGEAVAALAVSDAQPRQWTSDDVALIRDLAAAALYDLELLAERQAAPAPDLVAAAALPDAIVAVDTDWRITLMNDAARALLRPPGDEPVGRSFWDAFPALVDTAFHHECLRMTAAGTSCELEQYCRCAGAWLEVRAWPAADGGAALQLRDISARRTAQEELRGREARYRRLFEESRTPLFMLSGAGLLLEANAALAGLLGVPHETLYRAPLSRFLPDASVLDRLLEQLRDEGGTADFETALVDGAGRELVGLITLSVHGSDNGPIYHGAVHDITEQKRAQAELVRTAFQDPLTGLPNRLVFMDRLERVLQHSRRRQGHGFAVLFLDLDNFKAVNDTLGHLAGDQLLTAIARRLESCIRQEDTVARIGGDEFAVLLDMIHDIGSVTLVVDRIREALAEPFVAEGCETGATVSIGIAIALNNYERAEDLLRDADTAMYRAKAAGRDGYVIFDEDMHARFLAQRRLEEDLRSAVADEQLAVHYHPVVQLETGSVTGMEALVRWAHPERGILLPAEFMPLAERSGLIVEMGWWVLGAACRQLRAWQLEYPDIAFRLTMSVNLSARQFVHPDLVPRLDAILAETGLDPACLRLDLTEAVVMQNADLAVRLLNQLSERGIHICIDDFGTGMSSLPRLRELPISTLKIDRSFVHRLDREGEGREIVQSIIALGRSMAIDAIAEGVETPEQLEQLRRLGTRFAQGFLFSLPLDTAAASALLEGTRTG